MEAFAKVVSTIDGWLWGPWLLILLFGTHLYLTVRTGFIQKKLGLGIKLSVTKDAHGEGDVSQFAALTTALASTIGTGNIIGVGTAVALGGPGAVLWMWLTGVFGIATKYSESLIAVKYRVKTEKGTMLGGAMFALERGLKNKNAGRVLGILFALFAGLAAFGIGDGVQSNAVAGLMNAQPFFIPTWVTGLVLMIFTGAVVIGGLKWIAKVCENIVPFMAIVYVMGCIVCLIINAQYIGPAIIKICTEAFAPRAVAGGLFGYGLMAAARYGVARGLFSNESGMGSAPIVASAAKTANPVRQALVSMTGTFWDTVIICLMTGLVLVSYEVAPNNSGTVALTAAAREGDHAAVAALVADGGTIANSVVIAAADAVVKAAAAGDAAAVAIVGAASGDAAVTAVASAAAAGVDGAVKAVASAAGGAGGILTHLAFAQISIGGFPIGAIILTFGLFFFAFSTILGWSYYGERGAEYLLGSKVIVPYRILYTLIVFVGAAISLDLVWNIADALNGLMILPNIVAMLLLSGVIAAETKKYGNAEHIEDVDTDPVPFVNDVRKKRTAK